ncbi:Hint domain-containing protein [Paracoccus cavernae]|uniref:Hint domain-containing protein n=1 Tax=Paracoccus cavernae TaxID=1571207 RepID=A0ABT8DAT0_9RHOB|nr:Hint domain-containing protein [Paracoccus cavernae]
MPTNVTLDAWLFDPAFQYNSDIKPADWTGVSHGGPNNDEKYAESGSPIDLSSTIVSLTISDENEDDFVTGGGASDYFSINGVRYNIDYVYNGDEIISSEGRFVVVTFYGSTPDTNEQVAVSLPLIDGQLRQAFATSITGTDWIVSPNDLALPISEIPCFTRGTLITTEFGDVTIENLTAGTNVYTRDNGLQPIRWIGSRKIDARVLSQHESLRPIRISARALGRGTPEVDLLVSPQHRILVRSKIAQKMFGTDEVLVAAKQLLQIDGIDVVEDLREVEYFHILFDQHEVVRSNGAESESLYTGKQALKSLGAAVREEIFAIFPELKDTDEMMAGARMLLSGRQARRLAVRHAQNRRDLVL